MYIPKASARVCSNRAVLIGENNWKGWRIYTHTAAGDENEDRNPRIPLCVYPLAPLSGTALGWLFARPGRRGE